MNLSGFYFSTIKSHHKNPREWETVMTSKRPKTPKPSRPLLRRLRRLMKAVAALSRANNWKLINPQPRMLKTTTLTNKLRVAPQLIECSEHIKIRCRIRILLENNLSKSPDINRDSVHSSNRRTPNVDRTNSIVLPVAHTPPSERLPELTTNQLWADGIRNTGNWSETVQQVFRFQETTSMDMFNDILATVRIIANEKSLGCDN